MEPVREYTYGIDEDGRIWCDGEWYDAPEIYRAFYETMTRDEGSGRLYATCMGERCWIDAVDTPFVVDFVNVETPDPSDARSAKSVTLRLMGGVEEPLDPATLRVGPDNVLYCRVKDARHEARFLRPAYYELMRHCVPGPEGTLVLPVGSLRVTLA